MDDNRKTEDSGSFYKMCVMEYDPYVIGGNYNEEYDELVRKCPYSKTPGVMTLHLLMSKYIVNQTLPMPTEDDELIEEFISSYHLKYDVFFLFLFFFILLFLLLYY